MRAGVARKRRMLAQVCIKENHTNAELRGPLPPHYSERGARAIAGVVVFFR